MTRADDFTTPAVVARIIGKRHQLRYLRLGAGGIEWIANPALALRLPSLREAMRVAASLPEALKPFGMLERAPGVRA